MSLSAKKICVFDLDGTLVDSMEGFAILAAGLIEKNYSLDLSEAKALYYKTSGLPFVQQLEEIFPKDPRNADVAETYEKEKLKGYYSAPVYEDVREALAALKEKGFKLVISSNNHQEVVEQYLLKNLPIPFDLVLGYRPGFSKGKDHFDYIRNYFGAKSEDLFFVGDSLHDAQKGLENGIDFCGKLGTFQAKDFQAISPTIPTVPQIKDLIHHLCK